LKGSDSLSSLTVAIIGMVSAIFSPVIVEYLRGKNSIKNIQLKLTYNQKYIAYKNLSEKYGVFYQRTDVNDRKALAVAIWSAMLVCDEKSRHLLSEFLTTFEKNGNVADEALDKQFNNCLQSLNNDLQSALPVKKIK